MNFKLLLAFLTISLFVAGCTSSVDGQQNSIFGGGSNDLDTAPTSGEGLKVNFKTDDEWVSLREVSYELTLENDGRETLTLDASDFTFTTVRRTQEGSSLFYQYSIDNFYDRLFGSSNQLELLPGQKITSLGILELKESVYNDLNLEDFTYQLSVTYDYKTEFSANAEFDKTNRELSVGRMVQAAPVQVRDVDLRPRDNDFFDLLFEVRDVGSGDSRVIVDTYDFRMGSVYLTCDPFYEEAGRKIGLFGDDVALTSDIRALMFVCPFDTSFYDEGITNTIVTGELEYQYTVSEEGTVRLPNIREDDILFS